MNNDKYLVSIITPAYNAGLFIRHTVNTVLSQTHQAWEMVIVDDKSTDNTPEVLHELSLMDTRIRVITHQRNLGVADARNTALYAARSPVVAFIDSDDLWLPNKLETQWAHMRKYGHGFTYTAFRRTSEDGKQVGRMRRVPSTLGYDDLLKNTAIVTSSVMIDRCITGDFRMLNVHYEDFATWLSILKRGIPAHGVNTDLVRYRVSANSLSRNKLRSAKWIWNIYRNIEQLSTIRSTWCFVNYAIRGYLKYRSL